MPLRFLTRTLDFVHDFGFCIKILLINADSGRRTYFQSIFTVLLLRKYPQSIRPIRSYMRRMWYFTCVTWHIPHGRCQRNTQQFVFVEKQGDVLTVKRFRNKFLGEWFDMRGLLTFWSNWVWGLERVMTVMKWSGWRLDWKPQEQWKTVRNVLSENDVDPERVMEVPVFLGNHTTSRGGFTWEGILHEWFEFTINELDIQHISIALHSVYPFFPSACGHLFQAMETFPTNMTLNLNWMQIIHSRQSSWFSIYRAGDFLCEERAGSHESFCCFLDTSAVSFFDHAIGRSMDIKVAILNEFQSKVVILCWFQLTASYSTKLVFMSTVWSTVPLSH